MRLPVPVGLLALLVATLCGLAAPPAAAQGAQRGAAQEPLTVVLVRHAEKGPDNPDPPLTAEGRQRAAALAEALAGARVSAIYATQFQRTRDTAQPLAERAGVAVTVRPVTAENRATYSADLAREIRSLPGDGVVVVVGHSNSIPELVRTLSGQATAAIPEDQFHHFFVLRVPRSGPAQVIRARYGS